MHTHPEPEDDDADLRTVLTRLGPRLRHARTQRGLTLAEVSEHTGISTSTLSRLEQGGRRATLELLLPLAREYRVALDDLVGGPETGDPRVRLRPRRHGRMTVVPLTQRPGGLQAYKMLIPSPREWPEPGVHEGYEWLYVLSGRLRLVLGDREVVLEPGEAAEFDTRTPHAFGPAGDEPVEVLSLFGQQGERMHVRARPHPPTGAA
ncbi:helix-turn-helix domain-containing protein [Cellulomonas hominis]